MNKDNKVIFEAYTLNTEEGIRQAIRSGNVAQLSAKVLLRNYGDVRAIVEINGIRFAIDDSSRLKTAGIITDYTQKTTSQYFPGLRTGQDEVNLFKSLPKLTLQDFKYDTTKR